MSILSLRQAESKRVVAIIGHLRQIFRSVLIDDKIIRPVAADQTELILASASLRALFFDDTPSPILLDFVRQHELTIEVEAIETDSSMLLLSELEPGGHSHISDFFAQILFDQNIKQKFDLDVPHQFVAVLKDGFSSVPGITERSDLWAPNSSLEEKPLGTSILFQDNLGAVQISYITRRIINLLDWGEVRIGYLKNIPIRRRTIITYVANKLGGVHYDSTRFPHDPNDAAEFKALATSYDWDAQAITHAGLVAVALSCIELTKARTLVDLFNSLLDFHIKRQDRLSKGLPIAGNVDPG